MLIRPLSLLSAAPLSHLFHVLIALNRVTGTASEEAKHVACFNALATHTACAGRQITPARPPTVSEARMVKIKKQTELYEGWKRVFMGVETRDFFQQEKGKQEINN